MQWNQEAEARMSKVPFFVKRKVRQQVEEYVRGQGREEVTAADISAAKDTFFGRADKKNGSTGNANTIDNVNAAFSEDIPVTAEEIARLEKMVENGEVMKGLDSRYHLVKLCGGAAGCPLSVIDDRKVAQIMLDVLEETKLAELITLKLAGKPVLSHHKFKAGVAGCPNSCSEPQIKDFAVVGQRKPKVGQESCSGCGLCVKTCREKALKLENRHMEINYDNCLNCGLCIEACPKGVLLEDRAGYKIVVGGRLGRHPRLAETLVEMADENELRQLMINCIELLKNEGRPGERLSHLVERLGIEELKKRFLNKTPESNLS